MASKINYLHFCFIALFICALFACQEKEKDETPNLKALTDLQRAKIDSVCQSFIDKGNTIGFSLSLSHQGEIIYSKGFGLANVEAKKQASDSTIYPIASISKFITAITTLKMIEQNKLTLLDRVVDHLDDFPDQQYMDEITIEDLLRHQSGIIDHEDWFDSIYINENRIFTDSEFYAFIDQPLFFKPGSQYSYSNSGYAILSNILEKIENKSFHEIIRNYISQPLNCQSMGSWPVMWNNELATMGYEKTELGVDTSLHMMTESMKGDGGLCASTRDLIALGNALQDSSFFSKPSLDLILTPSKLGNIEIDYGLGVKWGQFAGQKTFGHSGGYKGTGWALLAIYPETDFVFAAAMNTNFSPEEVWLLRHQIMPIVLGIDKPTLTDKPIQKIERYTGTYSTFNRWGDDEPNERIVYSEGNQLFYDNPKTDAPGAQLFQLNDSIFTIEAFPFDEFRFHIKNGEVQALSTYFDGLFGSVRLKNSRSD